MMKSLLVSAAVLTWSMAAPLSAQTASRNASVLAGVVVRTSDDAPVPDAIVRVLDTSASAVSDAEGRFVLRGLPTGAHTLAVRHPDFGEHTVDVAVSRDGERFSVKVHLSPDGMSIELVDAEAAAAAPSPAATSFPVTVTEELAVPLATGPAVRTGTIIERARILELAGGSRNVGDLLRRAVPSLHVRESDATGAVAGSALCLEFVGTSSRSLNVGGTAEGCHNPAVLLDGVTLTDPTVAYAITAFEGLQWIQAIPPGQAGAQFGTSTYGVVLITTTRGAARLGAATAGMGLVPPAHRSTFDWEQDPNGHNFFKTFLGAAVGNAAGLAAGVAAGRRCVYVEDGTRELATDCNKAGVAGVGLVAFALPAMGSAVGAHFGGRTAVSAGRWVPALVGATMAIFPGYVFSLTTVGGGVGPTNTAGKVFLVVGTPLLTAVADRLYREVRAH